jgi:hypothetical protein
MLGGLGRARRLWVRSGSVVNEQQLHLRAHLIFFQLRHAADGHILAARWARAEVPGERETAPAKAGDVHHCSPLATLIGTDRELGMLLAFIPLTVEAGVLGASALTDCPIGHTDRSVIGETDYAIPRCC